MTDQNKNELKYTSFRAKELQLSPIKGNFDAAHLKAINQHIFQDMPGLGKGFEHYRPGLYRAEVEQGYDWVKTRSFETIKEVSHIAYSNIDAKTLNRLDEILTLVKPSEFAKLNEDDFAKNMSNLYRRLDYVHPFDDGNSRTLRTFTNQLAGESGYQLHWEKFNSSPLTRDMLYIARDVAVNKISIDRVNHIDTKRAIQLTIDKFENNKTLHDVFKEIISPIKEITREISKGKEYRGFER